MSTYNQLLFAYRKQAEEVDISFETLRAFLFELCNEKQVDLFLQKDEEADPQIEKKYQEGVLRILQGEPMNYVLGYSYFYGYPFVVNEKVLIPRYETEELVGLILGKIDEYYPKQELVLGDIGTGSGAIAIALKKEEPSLKVFASDISAEALTVAEENAKKNDTDVCFLCGDMLEPLINKQIVLDILVSNPPYIKADEQMEHSVIDYEPRVALFGGEDGLKFYRMIFEKAGQVVKKDGCMFFEIGYDQKERLSLLARSYFPDALIEVYKDINNKDRMMMIRFHNPDTKN